MNNLNKYGTSKDLFYLEQFEEALGRHRTREKILLSDWANFRDEELMEKRYEGQRVVDELTDLFEYYKYYINNPIVFGKEHFRILYGFYEKKKYLQYKKLKAVLDLDDGRNSLNNSSLNNNVSLDPKKSTKSTSKTFYIMNLIQTDVASVHNLSESKAFL